MKKTSVSGKVRLGSEDSFGGISAFLELPEEDSLRRYMEGIPITFCLSEDAGKTGYIGEFLASLHSGKEVRFTGDFSYSLAWAPFRFLVRCVGKDTQAPELRREYELKGSLHIEGIERSFRYEKLSDNFTILTVGQSRNQATWLVNAPETPLWHG